jgi:glycosyltransferase involved in cell wall biosynthesis
MIEAMACGTPTIAFRNGSVPELIEDGVNGFIVDSVEEAVQAVGRVPGISRPVCRAAFEKRFTASRMAADYVTVYRRMVQQSVAVAAESGRVVPELPVHDGPLAQ